MIEKASIIRLTWAPGRQAKSAVSQERRPRTDRNVGQGPIGCAAPFFTSFDNYSTGESGIAGFYVPNPSILNIIMGPLPSGGDDSAEINGLLGDIASGAGEGRLWLPGALYLFGSPLILQSNVDIKAKSTFRPTSGLTTGAVIEAPESAGITDVILDEIRVDGGFWDYGTGLAGVQLSRATRVKFINGKIVNCGGLGLSMQLGSADCKFLMSVVNGAGLWDGQGSPGVNISGSNQCVVALSNFLNCMCYGVLGESNAVNATLLGLYLDKSNNPSVTASGTWNGGDLETLTSPIARGFPAQGTVAVAGHGAVTYTGLDSGGAGFTGCIPSSGTVTNGALILSGFREYSDSRLVARVGTSRLSSPLARGTTAFRHRVRRQRSVPSSSTPASTTVFTPLEADKRFPGLSFATPEAWGRISGSQASISTRPTAMSNLITLSSMIAAPAPAWRTGLKRPARAP